MDRAPDQPAADGFLGPLTPEKVRRARERVAAIHDRIRRRGLALAQLPDPVDELVKAREGRYREL